MLIKDFYTLNDLTVVENSAKAHITINKNHEVFKGHFPGNPVTPGVCMMQIIKELTEQIVGKSLFMESSSNVKFMAIINPEKTPDLELTLDIVEEDQHYKVKNTTKFGETVALKLSMGFKTI
ncbi:3-hydroxyacyl-ACP dehydratase [Mangrovimonas sp. AS39]|uniref:3-hydroxyacyl-ACP dehydratase n=1 Tax=Mangrovimonas TaxID=1211036 RepID=UPI0006B64D06|nr:MULTISPECIES: 3-hydroxyacyl-ACP dehydratase [Mangrovimonas]MCF1190203.1 3-hydroxyacyl-ACP dehydratase [Mangrovimonas futianensis]MCF1194046.1 3-hydroxyacyl-ACP dehydratase [Mangrovimonas futianensis]MCF1421056.1 3-hydroxyacyl-ACP dehydratase [Mangrovimonas futianensis]